jgi:hypothetical protein
MACGAHGQTLSRGLSNRREIARTMNEMTNRIKRRASSDESCKDPVWLSGNFSATIEALVFPGLNNHERHRHGFAQRATEPEHDTADDRDSRVRHND